ncbi:methyl-accepting chemotaxis protein [Oceanibaculum sp.]|uniref:methyl-accepting chemotaxis protein n=1 Tax=Oceanibaculum sp. TaxID=1903597 RepID=UPI00258CE17C|nr:methyl-accepting chemotaxis protein [Oceanibaculum sp.]MCH2393155.1 methyl-accepting chemotaxis protein [Oceanibaculum sp.]
MNITVKALLMSVLLGLGAILTASGVVNLLALNAADDGLRSVYENRVIPLKQLKSVSDDYAVFIVDASHKVRNGNFSWEEGVQSVQLATRRIKEAWSEYLGNPLTAEEAKLVAEAKALLVPADKAVADLTGILQRKDKAALDAFVLEQLYQIIDPLTEKIADLITIQVRIAEEVYTESHSRDELAVLVAEILVGIGLIATVFGIFMVHRRVTRPMDELTASLRKLATDDYSIAVPHAGRGDEIGQMARAVDILKQHGIEAQELRAAQESERAEAERLKIAALEAMAGKVESETRLAVDQVSERTQAMDQHAVSMASSAEQMSMNSQGVAAAAQQALHNAEAVASAAEQMAASIREISSQVSHGSAVSQRAVETGARTEQTIGALSEAVTRIGEVATLISDIASQTNLLALNATIEAARAGEAGKGFAVVASEVKNLAGQTAKATEEIAAQIGNIQSVTKISVEAVKEIGRTIEEMSGITSTISAAIEEQSAATQEISHNINQTADASREVSTRIAEVSNEAIRTGQSASTVRDTSTEVATAISDLRQLLVRVVRTSMKEVDRRYAERQPANTPCTLKLQDRSVQAQLANLSEGGAMVLTGESVAVGTPGKLEIAGRSGSTAFTVVTVGDGALHLKFEKAREQQKVA